MGDRNNALLLAFMKAWLSSSADIYCTYSLSKFVFFCLHAGMNAAKQASSSSSVVMQ
jgi:hypothetical protein